MASTTPASRPVRTGIQYVIANGLVWGFCELTHPGWDFAQKSAVAGSLAVIVSALMVFIEGRLGKGLLRTVPPKPEKTQPTGRDVVEKVRGRSEDDGHAEMVAAMRDLTAELKRQTTVKKAAARR